MDFQNNTCISESVNIKKKLHFPKEKQKTSLGHFKATILHFNLCERKKHPIFSFLSVYGNHLFPNNLNNYALKRPWNFLEKFKKGISHHSTNPVFAFVSAWTIYKQFFFCVLHMCDQASETLIIIYIRKRTLWECYIFFTFDNNYHKFLLEPAK